MKNQKHYLASANSGEGFYNLFDNILDGTKSGYTYIIKGGPGTGKSTLMKKIGEHFAEKGEKIEFLHCSSDIDSVDGVRICDYNIAVVDGTSPHTLDANNPRIKDEIINLGNFICQDIIEFKDEILEALSIKNMHFKIAYTYLQSARKSADASMLITQKYRTEHQPEEEYNRLIKLSNLENFYKIGSNRNLFLHYIDKSGKCGLIKVNEFSRQISIDGDIYSCDKIISALQKEISERGYDTICFHDILYPTKKIGLYLPQADLFYCQREKKVRSYSKDDQINMSYNNHIITELLKKAGQHLKEAKIYHKMVERIYQMHMNYDELEIYTRQIISDIENRIENKL